MFAFLHFQAFPVMQSRTVILIRVIYQKDSMPSESGRDLRSMLVKDQKLELC